ncbi:UNVERIFIED_CONTAM: hypothetical protein K2H54_017218 [Gekko kuhli]
MTDKAVLINFVLTSDLIQRDRQDQEFVRWPELGRQSKNNVKKEMETKGNILPGLCLKPSHFLNETDKEETGSMGRAQHKRTTLKHLDLS